MSLRNVDKEAVREALVEQLKRQIDRMTELAKTTSEGATHEESRPENDKDTRGLEASYLARGQAERVAQLEADLIALRTMTLVRFDTETPIGISALVTFENEHGDEKHVLMAPRGGGLESIVGGIKIGVVTPQSPLGQELLGRLVDEEFDLKIQKKLRELVITEVA